MEQIVIPTNEPFYEPEGLVAWCEYCGKPGYVETHHIKTRGSGGKDILLNRIRLCPEHHRATQEYKIDRLELAQIVAKREGVAPEEVCQTIGIPVPDKFPLLPESAREPGLEELIQAYISLDEQEVDIKWTKAQLLDALLSTGVSVKWLASQLNVSVSFIRKYVKVYKAFPEESMRIPGLKFEHHNIALTSKKDPYEILARAADEHLSTRQMRKLIIEEEASDEFKDIAQKEEADEIQEAKKVYAKVESVIAKGGPGAEWLREKLIELVG